MKRIFYLFLLLLPLFAKAQDDEADFKYGQVSVKELLETKYDLDTTANAYYINDYGRAYLSYNYDVGFFVDYTKHSKIKIFNKNAYDEATIEEFLYKRDNLKEETIRAIKATTYYLENGVVKTVDVMPSNVITETLNEYYKRVKFTLPKIQDNCIIEYSYIITSPRLFNLHSWDFQAFIPKKQSKFRAVIPGNFNYNASLKGYLKLSDQQALLKSSCLSFPGGVSDCSDLRYSMVNIPAFKKEEYMTNPKNFMASINYELMSENFNNKITNHTKTWDDVYKDLKFDSDFYPQIKRGDDLFKTEIGLIKQKYPNEPLEVAKNIYDVVKSWYTWDNFRGAFTRNGVKKAYSAHTGNTADINLSLIGALQYAGINAEPILLSTRENGSVTDIYPVLSDFDYVIAKANINGESYLLDATDKLLDFGLLPYKALNDKGRAIGRDSSYWVSLTPTRKDKEITQLDLTLKDDGKFYGTIKKYYYDYAGYAERKAIKRFPTTEEFINNLDEKQSKLKIKNYKINFIDSVSKPLVEEMDVVMDGFDQLDDQKLIINPFFLSKYTENPFKLKERNYPVDFGMPSEETYLLNLTIPKDYRLINLPPSASLALPLSGGRYLFNINQNDNKLSISQRLELKAIFQGGEYPYLKELFNKMVENNKVDLILEKVK